MTFEWFAVIFKDLQIQPFQSICDLALESLAVCKGFKVYPTARVIKVNIIKRLLCSR